MSPILLNKVISNSQNSELLNTELIEPYMLYNFKTFFQQLLLPVVAIDQLTGCENYQQDIRENRDNCAYSSVPEPDLEIMGGPGHPDPEIRGEGGGSLQNIFFSPLGLSLV